MKKSFARSFEIAWKKTNAREKKGFPMLYDDQLLLALLVFGATAFLALKALGREGDVLSVAVFGAIAVFALPYLPLIFAANAITGLAMVALAVMAAKMFLGLQDYVSIALVIALVFVVGSAALGLV
ncbi:hypothetical protein AUJ65_03250 [Candidatus Micrarchaeota archaeon CG1_02_51_15]|nr:MAG: hypothetical protein AUJ65_03250 [Candidatus Micrarchaeota archaeon CG1_02_51_15]